MEHWYSETLRHILTAVVTSAVTYALLRQAKRVPAQDAAGNLVLRQPPLYRAMGLISAAIGVIMLFGTLLSINWERMRYDAHEQMGFGGAMLGALLFCGLSVPILQASATALTLTPLGVASNGPRGQHTFLLWHDITAVRYNLLTHELKISTPQASIKAGRYLIAFDRLVVELTNRLRLTPVQMGLPA